MLTLVSSAVIQQEVLTPIQMLWVNMIMDTLASLALATEAPEMSLLKRKPHNKSDHMISKVIIIYVLMVNCIRKCSNILSVKLSTNLQFCSF